MQTLSLYDMPSDVNLCIIKLTDGKGALGLIGVNKSLNRVLEVVEVKQYFNEIKKFYLNFIRLQHHYKRSLNGDLEIMNNRVITGKINHSNLSTPSDHFILKPALTEKQKKQLNIQLTFSKHLMLQETARFMPGFISTQQILDKDAEPTDMVLKPTLQEHYTVTTSNAISTIIFPISNFTLTFNPGSTLTEETKRKIIQSMDLANEYYANMALCKSSEQSAGIK